MAELPFATVAVPTRNEAGTIRACLESLLSQDYPRDRYEVLVLDGRSDDGTREIVAETAAARDVPLRLLDNPGLSVPAALNVAIEAARGEYLVRVDGHSRPEASYLRRSVEGNLAHDADLAGGWVRAVGRGPIGRAVAAAFASPFSMGNPVSWRRPDAPRRVVSVPCGSYRIASLRRIGGFDEGQLANQDYEANFRLLRAGGHAILLPEVCFDYTTRDSLPALARQFARYGFYKARTMAKHPSSVRARHLAPAAAALGATGLMSASPVSSTARRALIVGGAGYALALAGATARASRGLGRDALLLPPVFATMHVAWTAGNLAGLARWLPVRRRL